MNRPGRPRLALSILVALALLAGPVGVAFGGLLLEVGSNSSITFSVNNLNPTPTTSTPQFNTNDVLIYPGVSGYPAVIQPPNPGSNPVAQQPTANMTATPATSPPGSARNYTQTSSTNPSFIPSSYGNGRASTTVSNILPGNGAVAGSAGVSFNPGSFVSSSSESIARVGVMSVAKATAQFQATSNFATLTPGVFLDVAGFVGGGGFVAVGLKGTISLLSGPVFTSTPYQLIGAFAGPGPGPPPVTPAGGSFNSSSPPPGFQFEATGNVLLNPFMQIKSGDIITIAATLTLIADPNSEIELYQGVGDGRPAPDFGAFAGGPIGGEINDDAVATPEPSTWLGLLLAGPFAVLLLRRRRAG